MERMHPLTAIEIGSEFDIQKALTFGLLPTVWNQMQDPLNYLEGYINVYLHQEVAQEGLLRQLGDFARFLKVASFSQGQPLNITNVSKRFFYPGRECRVIFRFWKIF